MIQLGTFLVDKKLRPASFDEIIEILETFWHAITLKGLKCPDHVSWERHWNSNLSTMVNKKFSALAGKDTQKLREQSIGKFGEMVQTIIFCRAITTNQFTRAITRTLEGKSCSSNICVLYCMLKVKDFRQEMQLKSINIKHWCFYLWNSNHQWQTPVGEQYRPVDYRCHHQKNLRSTVWDQKAVIMSLYLAGWLGGGNCEGKESNTKNTWLIMDTTS